MKQLDEEVQKLKDQIEAMGRSGTKRPAADEPDTPSKKRFTRSIFDL
jgi:hypothetical protein